MWSRTSSDLRIVRGFGDGQGGSVEELLVGGAVEVELGGMLEGVELSGFLLVA